VDFGVPGKNYYAHDDGSITATKGGDGIYIGHTVKGQRLIVDVQPGEVA
jgi:hypothetical protein